MLKQAVSSMAGSLDNVKGPVAHLTRPDKSGL